MKSRLTIRGYLKVLRLPLAFLGFWVSLAIVMYTGGLTDLLALVIVFAVMLGNAGYTLLNEYHDREVDKILKPWKPIPSRQVNPEVVEWLGYSFLFIGVVLALYASYGKLIAQSLLAVIIYGGYIYNIACRRDLLGNVALALTYGCALLLVADIRGRLWDLLPLGMAFSFWTFSFNTCVSYQDREGDSKVGRKTIAIQLGKNTRIVAGITAIVPFITLTQITLPLYARSFFVITFLLPLFTSFWLKYSEMIELLCRKLGRLSLILAFTALMLRI